MSLRAILLASLCTMAALAGCSDKGGGGGGGEQPPLPEGKGAIFGLLLDDRLRPLPDGLVLLQPLGDTATSDANGEFTFTGLNPGSYVVRASLEGHEAAPATVQVEAGAYSELQVIARRIFSEGSTIIATEYSVFIPCAIDFVVNGFVLDCTLDDSGDSFRAGFEADYTPHGTNATWLVTEMKANKADRYEVQIRCSDDGNRRIGVAQFEGDYVKITNQYNVTNEEHQAIASYGPNVPWVNDCPLEVILFSDSVGREELQDAGVPVCCGAGAHFGIRAQFIQSLFIGPHDASEVEDYQVLDSDQD